ncbi:hypothetical protein BST27_25510 [Mycobacterium intermedium]|uniref:DUF4189 domain-containing protein n=1 Tax=Mycobacterium intermedium TaxID=28445 RepID=A0A1E3S6Q5_MYCIE|nr:DUF4189 domain-containing protein [Mycobacterium intermedium]MCV6966899.1 DUF4189 domain-containing protein [Mycobacterium intermedium]ODQ97267.1 hypothetical protein BHQ20_27205 [Mycobacterium intermedium]OPE47408.1 hypothetical protein BV508_22085 [Mycobacterium intermedium]ORA96437.1 hypothetical protein BST27_25510 [Mycobacterium intermedium]
MTSQRIYCAAAAAAALLSSAAAVPPTAAATTVAASQLYTVIAYSPITGYTGWANNATGMEEATHLALGNCQAHGSGCQVTSWAQNGCAALALGSGRWGGAWGANADSARANALAMVRAGRIVELHCTG